MEQPEKADHHGPEGNDRHEAHDDERQDLAWTNLNDGGYRSSSGSSATRSSWRISIACTACSRGTQRSTAA